MPPHGNEDRTCLNPNCDRAVDVIGVCVTCANSDYEPKKEGVETAGIQTPGFETAFGNHTAPNVTVNDD